MTAPDAKAKADSDADLKVARLGTDPLNPQTHRFSMRIVAEAGDLKLCGNTRQGSRIR